MSHRNPQPSPADRPKLIPPPIPRPGDSSQMLNKDQQKDSQNRQDEARLFGAKYRDSHAVKIKPGASLHYRNKKPGSSFAFSPQDKLAHNQNARSSGPVRSYGESNQQTSRRKSPQFDEAFEESSRPTKIRRQSETSETVDLTAPANSAIDRLAQPKNRRNRRDNSRDAENGVKSAHSSIRPQHDQFSSADSRDEKFTETAAQQRRNLARSTDLRLSQTNRRLNQPNEAIVIGSIDAGSKKGGPNSSAVLTNFRRLANGRESPDELQGDITTHRVPKSLSEKQTQTTRPSKPTIHTERPTRKRSPSDIPVQVFSPPAPATKKAKISHKNSNQTHELRYFRIGPLSKSCDARETVPIYSNKKGFELREDALGQGNTISILFEKITTIVVGEKPSRKVRMKLSQGSVEPDDQLDIEFWTTEEKEKLLEVLTQAGFHHQNRDMKWMDKSFLRYEKQFSEKNRQENKLPKKRLLDDLVDDPDPARSPPPRRPKLSMSLRDDHGEVNKLKLLKIKSALEKRRLGNSNADSRTSVKEQQDNRPIGKDGGIDVRSTVNTSERETRSSARRVGNDPDVSNEDITSETKSNLLRDDSFRENWKKPLVYPRSGKKKAEVTLGDRERLLRDDFLNDNLIALYMRFLQDHLERTNKEAAERIYFFNTYFFATLTNTPRGIVGLTIVVWRSGPGTLISSVMTISLSLDPADGVEPIRTPTLQKESSNASESEIQEIEETPEPEAKPKSELNASDKVSESRDIRKGSDIGGDLASLQIEANEHALQDTKSSEDQSAPIQNPLPFPNLSKSAAQKLAQDQAAASQPNNKSKKKRTGLKLDPNQPTIITFDSLDMPRSPTIKILREYICREAVSKRGVELDPADVKGMRARDIPLQPNFWDCGLYLLAYLEKFVQSPDWFITKVLQRSMSSKNDWPPLGSGLLRYRLGKFLDELYEEQGQANEPVMAVRQPVSFLLGPPLPCQEEIPNVDVVPESQQGTDPSDHLPNTVNSKTEESGEDSTVDQMHLLPTEKPSKQTKALSHPSADAKSQNSHIPPQKEEPIIQVPGSQEEPEVPSTPPPPTRKERKRQSPRGPLQKR
ncbi:Peptidase C48 SUMO/Sentrin/Ubl1 [Penicillium coprophilum]|uniref:Peptidase C48 SUMO/Sentrin/Ubl1 n=1 Tax=Penicillium coprophilum TaxID=36646 RepID=UPI00238280BB|nr:Peptidase C48 SUMO/Sentrin/Ubl1 [Penicillium coprophilum]KAJ5165502.1 Peptidase C48 SUMO/Sentrin/Ubl1 [Penicillium coprophilum]